MSAPVISRRAFLTGAAALGAAVVGCTGGGSARRAQPTRRPSPSFAGPPDAADCPALEHVGPHSPLWEQALRNGLLYGSSAATWQLEDEAYAKLFATEAAILFTEDDLLWWRLRPTPSSDLDFTYGDRIVAFAERHGMLVLGAHLVWDQGFGEGWTDSDLWSLGETEARELLFSTIDAEVGRYRGRVAAWIVANEVIDAFGLRTDTPWYSALGPSYVAESFRRAHAADPGAILVLNDFGYETDADTTAEAKRGETLEFLDGLLADGVPVHALGVQAHLHASAFGRAFDENAYARFLRDVADRGLRILVTELDVLDDGLRVDVEKRDRAVADVYRTYLDVALAEPAVAALITFGLTDRYTWLEEDFPRDDGAPRRPLPFDEKLRPKPAFDALQGALRAAARRTPLRLPARCRD